MLVTIVSVPNSDNTGLDLDRLEKVEDLPHDIAVNMLDLGTARKPSEAELATYHEALDKNNEPQPSQAEPAAILADTAEPTLTTPAE